MKKMTNKEFKEILTNAGIQFDIYGYEGILNMIATYKRQMAEKFFEEGYESLSRNYEDCANYLHDELEKRGLYK